MQTSTFEELDLFLEEKKALFGNSISSINNAKTEREYNVKWATKADSDIREYLTDGALFNTISLFTVLAVALLTYFF